MRVEDILFLGDTRSADDLAVFTGMAPERLCLGCGLRVEEPFAPLATGERTKLFYAAQKLLMFVLHDVSAQTSSQEEAALKSALMPLIVNRDGHFVAAVTTMFQSLLEGKTDCPISGVFGAGKTLSAAAMIAGLLVMDPSLKIMIVTKENVAAHAFAKHFLRLGLPDSINSLVGRLVGYVELQKGPASRTDLDIPPAFRTDVLRGKQVIIGCGGGFHQECLQPYSPVAKWMEDADVALNDEGQQYGNLDEASAVARTPRKCLVIWCGDHKQTPGGLRKTDEAKAFRRKLLRRPIALRGNTEHLQPNMLGKVVLRYLEVMDELLINGVKAMIRETMGGTCLSSTGGIATLRTLCQEVGCPFHDELRITVCCTALAVLWMALHKEKFPLLATSLQAAAGVTGSQRWALILPSSARVSLVTYTAVIAVRYPELDNVQNGTICFGKYLLGAQSTNGGFLPIFWDAPSAYMHAATDIGSAVDWLQSHYVLSSDENGCLAVLHNRNKMVTTFGNSEWATQSEGAVQSKSVTSCAGMTAHFVLLAQTKVGFLSGGRSKRMKELPQKEVLAQLEEAYARATVALTRALPLLNLSKTFHVSLPLTALSPIQLKPLALVAPPPSSSLSRCQVSWPTLEKLRLVTLLLSPEAKASALSSSPLLTNFPPVLSAPCAPCAATAKVSSPLVRPALIIKLSLWMTSPTHLMITVGRSLTKSLTSALGASSLSSWASPMALLPTSSTSPPVTRLPQAMSGNWRQNTLNGTALCLDTLVLFLALHLTPSHSLFM